MYHKVVKKLLIFMKMFMIMISKNLIVRNAVFIVILCSDGLGKSIVCRAVICVSCVNWVVIMCVIELKLTMMR